MREAEEAKLAVKDPNYKPPKESSVTPQETATKAASTYKALRDAGAAPEVVASVMQSGFGLDINQENVRTQLDADLAEQVTDIGKADADTVKALADIRALGSEAEQLEAFNKIGKATGYGDKAGNIVKELIDTGKYGIRDGKLFEFPKDPGKGFAHADKAAIRQNAESELATLMGDRTSFGELTPDEQKQFRSLYQSYQGASTGSSTGISESDQDNIAFGYRFLDAVGRFSENADESVRGIYDDARNFVLEYAEVDSPSRRKAIALNLAALLGSVRLDSDRTPKFVFDEMKKQLGGDFGVSFQTAVEGAISAVKDLQAEFSARSGAAARDNFEAVIYSDVLSKAEPILAQLNQFKGVAPAETSDIDEKI